MKEYNFDNIAQDYHLKRKKPWNSFISFLKYLENKNYSFKGLNIDLGCGNGRHFPYLMKESNVLIGIDNSIELLKISNKSLESYNTFKIQIICADLLFLPIRNNSINNIFSVAVIHHIKDRAMRENGIKQLFNIIKNGGYLLITVWRRWQVKYRKFFVKDWIQRKIKKCYKKHQESKDLKEFGDKIVPWTISSNNKTYDRFYHFFSKHEIENLINIFNIKEFKTMGGSTGEDNFFILAQKVIQ